MNKMILTAAISAALVACGGGSESAPQNRVNPLKVEQVAQPAQPAQHAQKLVTPSSYELAESYGTLVQWINKGAQTHVPTADLEKVTSWYFVLYSMLHDETRKGSLKRGCDAVRVEIETMRATLNAPEFAGRMMSAVKPRMIAAPNEWETPVRDYYAQINRSCGV